MPYFSRTSDIFDRKSFFNMNFIGKSAICTGGSSGIGFETSRNLLIQGVEKLAIFDINCSSETIDKLKNEFPVKTIVFQKTDVSNKLEVERSFNDIFEKFGYIDILVNSAGICDEKNLEKTFSINLLGTVYTTLKAIELMSIEKGGKGGIIANIASINGLDIVLAMPFYNASKHAVVGFTRTLADSFYYKFYGIKFVLICPGLTSTPIIDGLHDRLYRNDTKEALEEFFGQISTQSAEVCGKLLVDLLHMSKNGSTWIIDNSRTQEVTFDNFFLSK